MRFWWFAPWRWFNFSGRASRRELIGYYLLIVPLFLPLMLLGSMFDPGPRGAAMPPFVSVIMSLTIFAFLGWVLVVLAVKFRRVHDHGQSAVNLLWGLVPLLGWIVTLVLMFTAGDEYENEYGANPRLPEGQDIGELERIF